MQKWVLYILSSGASNNILLDDSDALNYTLHNIVASSE
jgi:hypothetical protein